MLEEWSEEAYRRRRDRSGDLAVGGGKAVVGLAAKRVSERLLRKLIAANAPARSYPPARCPPTAKLVRESAKSREYERVTARRRRRTGDEDTPGSGASRCSEAVEFVCVERELGEGVGRKGCAGWRSAGRGIGGAFEAHSRIRRTRVLLARLSTPLIDSSLTGSRRACSSGRSRLAAQSPRSVLRR